MNEKISVSVGIPAFNEEQNIEELLKALKEQQTEKIYIAEIIVIASGCTDKTIENARKMDQSLRNLRILIQPEREGKASAINDFLKLASEEICVLSSADIIPASNAIEMLCAPFKNPSVGMTGARPIPMNSKKRFLGFAVQMLWKLHHEVALKTPKCGEMIAFRKLFNEIDIESPVDEASIEAEITKKNFQIEYVPEAIVQNKGPETLREFIEQRKRIHFGHLWLKKKYQYGVATNKKTILLPLIGSEFNKNMKHNLWILGLILLELWSRLLAKIDFFFLKKNYTQWKPMKSTKKLTKKS